MDWLAGWLKTVIMVIMLATFVDLLLPSNTMQRYVKTVLSLFILLTLLSPVLQLFQKDWNLDRLIGQAESQQNARAALAQGIGGSASMPALNVIQQDAQKLQNAEQKQTQLLVQTQLANAMKEQLQKETNRRVKDVAVQVQIDNNGKPAIQMVKVTLDDIEAGKKTAPGDRSIAAVEPVKPVEPIRIDRDPSTGVKPATVPDEGTPRLSEDELTKLQGVLTQNWLVHKEQMDFQLEVPKGWIAR
ncbi:stage III sporulation protein AF [Paenibacillus whitsoniae]|uniref:Stage III sporulation protein AF n=1 Tax=Paenibacillus whitsoniae TaxID=2496558 RepID=A0A3S0AQ05_9BACL|nr:stage III sporulation protein AF [Paenibacillus whitsoniae]RTE09715.1 stage III sporulation protein AF [Paenibacillus whitsoniae]